MRNRRLPGMLLALFIASSGTLAYGAILHQEISTQVITKGATLTNNKLLIDEGWRNINILKVDLKEPNVELRPIESSSGTERQTVLQMVQNAGAVAGVNADFFDMSSSTSPSFGPIISNGVLKHAYNSNYSTLGPNKYMGTFTIDTNNTPSMAYYGISLRLNTNGTLVGAMGSYNIVPTTLYRPIVLDSTYHKDTSTALAKLKNTYTIVVEENTVTYQAKADEVVTIPKNGYVVLIPASDANNYYKQLPVGTSVEIEQSMYLSEGLRAAVNNMKLGIGGGGLIIKDGLEYTGNAHKITPTSKDPRTIVATLKDSNEILLITIDGRGIYKGMTHSDLVTFLKEQNVKDAMYFDGGGSTTMVARNTGDVSVSLQNNPSDGSSRKVINGLGVFTTSETGALSKLYIESTYDRTFVGEPISFTVKGVDANSNPINLQDANINFSVTGVTGEWSGNKFTPTSSGKALIIASYDGIEVAKEIVVSNTPRGIRIEPSNLQIDEQSSKNVQVYGIDSEGYKLPIDASKLVWTSDHTNVSASGNSIAATSQSLGTLTADYKGLTAKVGVIVGSTAVPVESFETNSANWAGDTSTVTGKVEASKDVKYHGESSIKMTYTFEASNNKQVAYTLFGTPIEVPTDAKSINMWVNAKKQGHVAKIEVVDANGKKYYLKLTDSLNFEGWKYLSVDLPKDMVLPAKVTKFYTYANSVAEKTTSAVYIDHVSITRGFKDKAGISVRDDYRFDPWYKESLQAPTSGQYMISAVGPTKVASMMISNENLAKMGKQLSEGSSIVLYAASSNSNIPLTTNSLAYNNTYQVVEHENTKVIMAGTDAGGLRATNVAAWLNIKASIEKAEGKNIILIMSKNPLTGFSDAAEGKAFHDYLVEQRETRGKNIFVVHTGSNSEGNEVRIEDGIRYIKTSGISTVTDNVTDGSFVKFKMVGNEVYYTFEQFK